MIVRRIARPMLAGIFIWGGINALRFPAAHAPAAEPVTKPLAAKTQLPDDTELLVRANGAAMVAGGALLAAGRFPRLASLVLSAAVVPQVALNDFWNETHAPARTAQRGKLLKNVGLLGGLLLSSVDTAGKPGLVYRAGMASDSVSRGLESTRREAKRTAREARLETKLAALRAKNALG